MASTYRVVAASYGALVNGDENQSAAFDVTVKLQGLLDHLSNGVVTINNTMMGGDPAPGNTKHFGAVLDVNGTRVAFACQEDQTINFG
ncbi:MAG TPA: hypothetical protein VFR37_15130 [Longimicrobium sp.]|nr:hypothetical protein [Longimicrobium sp.]